MGTFTLVGFIGEDQQVRQMMPCPVELMNFNLVVMMMVSKHTWKGKLKSCVVFFTLLKYVKVITTITTWIQLSCLFACTLFRMCAHSNSHMFSCYWNLFQTLFHFFTGCYFGVFPSHSIYIKNYWEHLASFSKITFILVPKVGWFQTKRCRDTVELSFWRLKIVSLLSAAHTAQTQEEQILPWSSLAASMFEVMSQLALALACWTDESSEYPIKGCSDQLRHKMTASQMHGRLVMNKQWNTLLSLSVTSVKPCLQVTL